MTMHHDRLWTRTLMATSALVALSVARPAAAQTRTFNIEAQPAQTGITAFARQADIQILVSRDVVEGLFTRAVKGQFDTQTALRMLLDKTGLDAKATGERAFTVVRRAAPEFVAPIETVVVTGRAGSLPRTRADSSYSVSVIPQEQLREQAVSSVADSIRSVPGFWVENSGGEASANVRARGLPVDGFGSVQLEEDGLPVQHDPALGYLNADQSFRLDETIGEVQVVRGGPSSIFNSNAPGGVINYLTRQPGEIPEGLVKLSAGDDGLGRADFWYGAKVNGWKLAIGGYYRYEQGTRDPGYALNNGGQVRIDIGHELGNGSVDVDYKHIDDTVGFYVALPVSINGKTVSSIPGFNANTGSIIGGENAKFPIYTPNGPSEYDLSRGTKVRLDQLSIHATQSFGDGWRLDNRFRIRGANEERNYLTPSAQVYTTSQCVGANIGTCLNGLSNVMASAATAFPGATSLQLRYADNGQVVSPTANGNGLVMPNTANLETIYETEVLDDFRLSKHFTLFGQKHDVTAGAYVALINENFHKYQATLLTDVENHARPINVVALNAAGQVVGSVTNGGVIRDGSGFGDGTGIQNTEAIYFADEWHVTDALRIDAGVRQEWVTGSGSYEGVSSVNLTSATGTLATSAVAEGNGIFTPYTVNFSAATWTLGVNYQIDGRQGVFARVTAAARLPGISNYITNTSPPTPGSVETSHSQMYELGYKFSRSFLDAYVTLFDTETQDYGLASQPVLNPVSNIYVNQEANGNTRDYGVELDGDLRPVNWFDVAFTATFQDPQFTHLLYALSAGATPTSYADKQLLRIPHTSASVSPSVHFMQDRLKLGMTVEYYGSRYADVSNTQYLPAYTVLSVNAHYDVTPRLSIYGSVYNLTNAIGLTEGNARAGEVVPNLGPGTDFVARPIVGRTFKASVLYRF